MGGPTREKSLMVFWGRSLGVWALAGCLLSLMVTATPVAEDVDAIIKHGNDLRDQPCALRTDEAKQRNGNPDPDRCRKRAERGKHTIGSEPFRPIMEHQHVNQRRRQ